jgi:hypothetical protein
MKNLYLKVGKSLIAVASEWLNSLKKDFLFYNSHTELLAIWSILFITTAGLFIFAIKGNFLVVLLLFVFSIIIMIAGTLLTTYYLHALKYRNRKGLLPKIHNVLNKSFN